MTPIPKELSDEMSNDVFYSRCARSNGSCEGRITWEHAFIYAGKQIQEKWSIIPLLTPRINNPEVFLLLCCPKGAAMPTKQSFGKAELGQP